MTHTHRYLAQITVEADRPIAVGSGERGITVDRLIARDALGLPYIPGSSLAGVLRHALDPSDSSESIQKLFGFQKGEKGQGSRLAFSSGHLIGEDGSTVLEGPQVIDFSNEYFRHFNMLPQRDHVRMTDKGAADTLGHGKFDEELVHKGTRFVFSLELRGDATDMPLWEEVLSQLHHPLFRIGAGSRKGFGKLKIVSCHSKEFDLNNNLAGYLDTPNSLNRDLSNWEEQTYSPQLSKDWIHYQVRLSPENFFLFAAGHGDREVATKPKTEKYFDWETGKPVLTEKAAFLIPATSIKGALSHRVAYKYNQLSRTFVGGEHSVPSLPQLNEHEILFLMDEIIPAEKVSDPEELAVLKDKIEKFSLTDTLAWQTYETRLSDYEKQHKADFENPNVGEANKAVKALFGYANDENESGERGNVILSDVYLEPAQVSEKIFSHVALDRFTSGARDGMLFQEQVASCGEVEFDIYVNRLAFEKASQEGEKFKIAFESALSDLCQGELPLGGSTNRGHGIFTGSFTTHTTQ